MSKLFAELFTKTIQIEGENITIQKLSLGDQMEASKAIQDDAVSGSIIMLIKSIKKWVTADGINVDITKENILRIKAEVALELSKAISEYNNLSADKIKN